MLTTEFKFTHDNNVYVLRPLANTFLFNGVGSQEFEVYRCITTCTYKEASLIAPVHATRAEVIAKIIKRNSNCDTY